MMKVHASGGSGGRRAATGGGTRTTLRQRYTANRQAGRGRVSSAVNALRGRGA